MSDKIWYIEIDTVSSNKIKEATELYNSGKMKEAIDIVEALLKETPNDLTIHVGYAEMILNDNSKHALELVEMGLYIDANNWVLLKLKANILTNYVALNAGVKSEDSLKFLNVALECIRKSKKIYSDLSKQTEKDLLSDSIGNSAPVAVKFLQRQFELDNLESTILSIRNSVVVLTRTEKVEQLVIDSEKRLYKERTRIIELLGLFVAIFVFIFSSIQIVNRFDLIDAILIVVAIGLILMSFVLGLHLAINPEERMRKLIFMLGILIFTLFILPLMPGFIKGIKYYLQLQ